MTSAIRVLGAVFLVGAQVDQLPILEDRTGRNRVDILRAARLAPLAHHGIDIGQRHQQARAASGQRLGHAQLVKVARAIVVDGERG
jgi:hypothetical protein